MDNPTPSMWSNKIVRIIIIFFCIFIIAIAAWYIYIVKFSEPQIEENGSDSLIRNIVSTSTIPETTGTSTTVVNDSGLVSTFASTTIESTILSNNTSHSFSVIVMPDTQKYALANSPIFCQQTQWILDEQKKRNIVFVSQLGDIVDSGARSTKEWELASLCMGKLDGKVPYGIIPGNHDVDDWNRNKGVKTYDKYFPASRYSKYSWYKGNRKENQNNYELITVNRSATSTIDLIFLNLEIEPSNNTIAWANDIVKKYPHAYIILTTHKYLPDDSTTRDTDRKWSDDGNTGEDIWNKLVKNNCNIRMVWSGHFHTTDGENRIVSKNSCNQDVPQILQDYQERENGGNGLLRIYTFNPITKNIEVQTYSPYTKKFEEDESSHFTVPFAI